VAATDDWACAQTDGKVVDQYIVAGAPQAIQEQHPVHTMQTVMDTQVHPISSHPQGKPHLLSRTKSASALG